MLTNASQLFQQITHGVYVISVKHEAQTNAFTAAWVMQVSFSPSLLCFSINPEHRSYKLLQAGKVCCISVLNRQQLSIANHFGQSSAIDKMRDYEWIDTLTGAPALAESLAYLDCRVSHCTGAGDHVLVVCEVMEGRCLAEDEPLLYRDTGNMDNSAKLYEITP